MLETSYTFAAVSRILDVPENKLRYWAQIGFVGPSLRKEGKAFFTFQDLIGVKAAKELALRGFKPGQIRKALLAVRASLPHVDRPLDRIRVAFNGEVLVVVDDGSAFEVSGQRVFDFGLEELARQAADVHAMPPTPAPAPPPPQTAYDWFMAGVQAEEQGRPADDAAACYRKALQLDAGLSAAHNNLGQLAHQQGDVAGARAAFQEALALDPEQPEARYNLANLILESGDAELAVAELKRVLQLAPDFADAHYNLAVALERLGGRAQARAHLQRYLELESTGPWADAARALLQNPDQPPMPLG